MEPSTRRRFLAALAGGTTALSGCSSVLDGSEPSNVGARDSAALQALPASVSFTAVVEGLDAPVATADVANADAYVVERPGRVVAFDDDGRRERPVLDQTGQIVSGGEMGMLGIALHPAFPAGDRRAFVRYSAPSRPGTPDAYDHTFVLAEFEVREDDGRFAPESERTILEIPEPQPNHNAGDVAFGPDGLLYVPTGDGGGADDVGTGHADDWYDAVPGGNGQDVTDNLLGGLLRIDVDATPTEHPRTDPDAPAEPDGDAGYAIPDDNPLVGREGRDEYYAWGLRNPWQLSFDDGASGGDGAGDDAAEQGGDGAEQGGDGAEQGDDPERDTDGADLYVADVGQAAYEEVNRVERGGNYGWNVREGTHCFAAEGCPEETPADVRDGGPLRDPVVEYPHSDAPVSGVSVIGGYVYRGGDVPALRGAYVFGDLQPNGRLFAAVPPAGGSDRERWQTTTVGIEGADVQALYAFGRTHDDELYALGEGSDGGTVWRIAARN